MGVGVNPPKTPVTKGSNGIACATIPNICKMPGPPAPFVPTPLPNIGKSGMSPKGYSKKVKVEGKNVAIRGATFKSMGDVASKATGGGLVSMNTHGPTKFIMPGSMNVKFEGKNVQLLGDMMLNNCGPSGSPPNAATMTGEIQIPELKGTTDADLKEIAKKCNDEVNKANGYSKSNPPSGTDCTTLGTKKHKCCEESIKNYNETHKDSPLRSEVAYDKNGNLMSAEADSNARSMAKNAYDKAKAKAIADGLKGSAVTEAVKGVWAGVYFGKGGAGFKADVIVLRDPSKPITKDNIKTARDFKFNCSERKKLTKAQKKKYGKYTGARVKQIFTLGNETG